MGEGRPIWPGIICAAVRATGGVLAACSNDPIEPAAVYMMGSDRAADRYAPATPGSRSVASLAGTRRAMPPAVQAFARTAQPERRSQHTIIAANYATLSHEKAHAGHPAMSHATAAHRAKASATRRALWTEVHRP